MIESSEHVPYKWLEFLDYGHRREKMLELAAGEYARVVVVRRGRRLEFVGSFARSTETFMKENYPPLLQKYYRQFLLVELISLGLPERSVTWIPAIMGGIHFHGITRKFGRVSAQCQEM